MTTIIYKKENGSIKDKEQIFKKLESTFLTLKNGEYELVHKIHKKNRNNDQNALMWMWFACLENELGQDKQEIYQYYCEKFIPECCTYFRDGRFDSGGTSKLKTDEMAHFLKKIQADAASEFGCQLPTREDMFFDDFRMKYERYTH